jgi:hypothetical protein
VRPEVEYVVCACAFDVREQVILVLPCPGYEISQKHVEGVRC